MGACYKIKTRQEGCLNSQRLRMAPEIKFFIFMFHFIMSSCPFPQGMVNSKILNVSKQDTERTDKMYLYIVVIMITN